jgi:soluble P-type ATPase
MPVAMNGQAVGLVAAADRVRATSRETVARLKALGIQVAMLTGDNRRTAEAVGHELGIDRMFAEVQPSDKANYVKQLQGEGLFTAMVGDGINDAPALAQADLGIAIGAGTGVAIETAEVVLMRSDPLDVLAAIRLSKATVTKMKQNLFWAAIYNVIAIPVAAGVLYPFGILLAPEVGALAMSASSITVATNAVLLKSVEKKLRVSFTSPEGCCRERAGDAQRLFRSARRFFLPWLHEEMFCSCQQLCSYKKMKSQGVEHPVPLSRFRSRHGVHPPGVSVPGWSGEVIGQQVTMHFTSLSSS